MNLIPHTQYHCPSTLCRVKSYLLSTMISKLRSVAAQFVISASGSLVWPMVVISRPGWARTSSLPPHKEMSFRLDDRALVVRSPGRARTDNLRACNPMSFHLDDGGWVVLLRGLVEQGHRDSDYDLGRAHRPT